ncbi:MAG: GNAT family N-acetyltransferase [Methanothrix sp.]
MAKRGVTMIITRPYAETDNATLLEIEKLCPQGDDRCALGVDKKGNILARYDMYDNWKVLVAEVDGMVIGWIGWTVKDDPLKRTKYVYLTEVMVHPNFRGKGVATNLINKVEIDAKQRGADHVYCFIYEPNLTSKSLFEEAGYSEKAVLWQCALMVYKKAGISQEYSIKNPEREDLQEVVQMINKYNESHAHFVPFAKESFEAYASGIPAYGLNNFWVAKKGGEIVACAGIWDSSYLADLYYAREPAALKAMGKIFSVLGRFIKLPKIAPEGANFNFRMTADYAFDPEYPEAMQDLIGFLNNRLLEAKVDCLLHVTDPEDMSFEIIKRMKPQIEKWSAYTKALNGDPASYRPFYVDVRDIIP